MSRLKASRILVTGGGGFLGKAIVKTLLDRGAIVASLSRQDYPQLWELGCKTYKADLADFETVKRHLTTFKPDAVIHTAAKAGIWGSYQQYAHANIEGTNTVIKAMKSLGIPYLVYTSTPSVTFDGKDQNGVDESTPYTTRFYNHYQKTKTIAELEVLKANCKNLQTTALRPHLIWGPEDPHLIPRILAQAKAKRLRLIDKGQKLVDAVYIDNAAYAHVLALEVLMSPSSEAIAGKAYFISNHEPWPMASLINSILNAFDQESVHSSIPAKAAYALGYAMEKAYQLCGSLNDPPMTRFVALQLATSHWFDPAKSRGELGYKPLLSMAHGMELLANNQK